MRIIAGKFGGRLIEAPKSVNTHPMSEKMRGGLFNVLGDIDGLSVLDIFAGSGALGLEALSRGADSVILIERDRRAQETVERNLTLLGASGVRLIRTSARPWLKTIKETFDLILADPPYNDLQEELLEMLSGSMKPAGTLVLSWPGKLDLPAVSGLMLKRQKSYGDGQLGFYVRT